MDARNEFLVVANWKMNPRTLAEARTLFRDIKKGTRNLSSVLIAPPFPYLTELKKDIGASKVALCAQDLSTEVLGARTGEVSASMLKSVGASHVIVGHSERRAHGEDDVAIGKKMGQAVKAGLVPILCVGERERDPQGKYFGIVEEQIKAGLKEISGAKLAQVAIAYEPVWAISTSTKGARPATPEDAHEMVIFIRKTLTDLYGRASAGKARIIYGGSVTEKNIGELVRGSGAQGFLVGGASLRAREFKVIIQATYDN